MTRQDTSRQDKTRQDNNRLDKAKQDKTIQDNFNQEEITPNSTRQYKTINLQYQPRGDNTIQDKTRTEKTR